MSNKVKISGVSVNLDNENVKNAKSRYDVEKLDIFEHLDESERIVAYDKLLVANGTLNKDSVVDENKVTEE